MDQLPSQLTFIPQRVNLHRITTAHLRYCLKFSQQHPVTTIMAIKPAIHACITNFAIQTSGFSRAGAFFFALRSRLMSAIGLRFRPRENRRRTRQPNSGISCSLHHRNNLNKFVIIISTIIITTIITSVATRAEKVLWHSASRCVCVRQAAAKVLHSA